MKAVVIATLLFGNALSALDVEKLNGTGYVNDFAGVLDAATAERIAVYCGNVERATGAQFAVAIVKSLEGDTVEDAAVRLFEKWGVGGKQKDEGLLLLLAVEDRKNRIEVGYGLEAILTDGDAGDALRSVRPILRQGDYGGAVLAALQLLGQQIADAKGVTIDGQRRERRRSTGGGLPIGLIFVFIIAMILMAKAGGRRGPPRGGMGGPGDLLTGMILGQMMNGGRRGNGWSHGGFGGSGGDGGGGWSGGGGFGGFGGGGSGGGGASGDW
jgi:uncharacterized protein